MCNCSCWIMIQNSMQRLWDTLNDSQWPLKVLSKTKIVFVVVFSLIAVQFFFWILKTTFMLSGPYLQSYIIAVKTRKSKRILSNYQKSRGPLLDPTLLVCFCLFCFRIFSGRFDTSGSMVPRLVQCKVQSALFVTEQQEEQQQQQQ